MTKKLLTNKKLLSMLTIVFLTLSIFSIAIIPASATTEEPTIKIITTIDGVMDSGEWDTLLWITDTDTPLFEVYITNDNEFLYIAVDVPSGGYVAGNLMSINVDWENDGGTSILTDDMLLYNPGSVAGGPPLLHWGTGTNWDGGTQTLPTGMKAESSGGALGEGVSYEFKLPLTVAGHYAVVSGDTIGISFFVNDGTDANAYPNTADGMNPSTWEDLDLTSTHVNVGDTVTVSGTCTSPGGLIEVYWDSVKAWDGDAGLLTDDYAVGTTYEIDITIPEAEAGNHYVIVKDIEAAEIASTALIVEPEIVLDPDVGIEGDTITVTGTGFAAESEIELSGLTVTTVPSTVTTSELGSFTCEFDIPDETDDDPYTITATDEDINAASDTLTVGKYITLTPDRGLISDTITVTGRGFTADETIDILWHMLSAESGYITVVDDYDLDANGDFSVNFDVPLLADPDAPGQPYTVEAIDSEDESATDIFTLVEDASITLSTDEGLPEAAFTVLGEWFTEDSEVTITFNGEELETVTTDGVGAFPATALVVPEDAEPGDYTVTATDAEDVSDSAAFTVLPPPSIEIRTRATEYLRGDAISLYANCSLEQDAVLVITDPDDIVFYAQIITANDNFWQNMDGWYAIPYLYGSLTTDLPLGFSPLPSDAPLGTWNFTAYEPVNGDIGDILDSNLFTVAERPTLTLATIIDQLDDIELSISTLIDDTGDLVLLIETEIGSVLTSLEDVNATLVGIDGDVVTIMTDVGELDISALQADMAGVVEAATGAQDAVGGIQTSVYIAIILSLIAALAAAAGVLQISRRIAA